MKGLKKMNSKNFSGDGNAFRIEIIKEIYLDFIIQ